MSTAELKETSDEKDQITKDLEVKVSLLRDALKRIAFEPIPNEVPDEDAARWLAKYAENALEQVKEL